MACSYVLVYNMENRAHIYIYYTVYGTSTYILLLNSPYTENYRRHKAGMLILMALPRHASFQFRCGQELETIFVSRGSDGIDIDIDIFVPSINQLLCSI